MGKSTRIILCAVLCLPIIAALIIGAAGNIDKAPGSNELTKVSITDESGAVYEYSDSETLDFYKNIIKDASGVSSAVASQDAVEFTATYSGTVGDSTYTFIMSPSEITNCLYKNVNGETFMLAKDDAYALLLRNEFSGAYRANGVSSLNFAFGSTDDKVEPTQYSWKYKRVDGEYAADEYAGKDTALKTVKFPENGTFAVSFDKNPDYVQLTAYSNGVTVFTGTPEGLRTELNYEKDTMLKLKIEAKWYEAENAESFGEAVYDFNFLYDVPTSFSLVNKQLKQGEFTIIRVKNGNDGEEITATADFMAYPTHVFEYGGEKYIYVPIKTDATPGNYTIVINEPAGPSSLQFKVNDAKFKSVNESYRASVITLNTTKSKEEYSALLAELQTKGSAESMWNGKFVNPVEDGKTVCAFGTTMNITGIETKICDGMYISGKNGAKVKAANSGKVIYAGSTDYTGNAVVIDHGLGVYSYYFNLGTVSCAVGDAVTSASVIGTVGTSGVTPYTDTVYYANSLEGCFVNPQTQIKYGITF